MLSLLFMGFFFMHLHHAYMPFTWDSNSINWVPEVCKYRNCSLLIVHWFHDIWSYQPGDLKMALPMRSAQFPLSNIPISCGLHFKTNKNSTNSSNSTDKRQTVLAAGGAEQALLKDVLLGMKCSRPADAKGHRGSQQRGLTCLLVPLLVTVLTSRIISS